MREEGKAEAGWGTMRGLEDGSGDSGSQTSLDHRLPRENLSALPLPNLTSRGRLLSLIIILTVRRGIIADLKQYGRQAQLEAKSPENRRCQLAIGSHRRCATRRSKKSIEPSSDKRLEKSTFLEIN